MKDVINFKVGISTRKLIRNVVLVIAIGAVLFTTYYLHNIEPNLSYSELVKITTGGFLLIGLIYSIMTYDLTQKKNQHDMRMQKMTATYNACSEWHSMTMMDHIVRLSEFGSKPEFKLIKSDIVKFAVFFDKEENKNHKISYLCLVNYFESLSIAADESLMDEEFVRKYFYGIFKRFYDDYLPYIQNRRMSTQNPKVLIGFTTIVEKWKTIQ